MTHKLVLAFLLLVGMGWGQNLNPLSGPTPPTTCDPSLASLPGNPVIFYKTTAGGGGPGLLHCTGVNNWSSVGGATSAAWGSITGTLSSQTDLQSALNLKAPLASPSLSGVPTAPTVATADNSTSIATTAWVKNQGYGGAGSAAWGNITGTLSNQTDLVAALGLKAPLASPALTGSPTAPTPATGDNSTLISTTAFVKAQGYVGAGGNVATATALASTPSTCGIGVAATGVDAQGNAVSCFTPSGGGGSSPAIDCSIQAGADVGAKLQACATAATAVGAIADATRLNGHITANRTISNASLKLRLGPQTWTLDTGFVLAFTGDDLEMLGTGDVSLITSPASDASDIIQINSNRAHLSNFKIVGNRIAGGTKNNIYVNSDSSARSNITIDHVTSQDSGGMGIKVKNCTHCRFDHNLIQTNKSDGFYSEGANDLYLTDNILLDNNFAQCGGFPKVACQGHGNLFFSSSGGTQTGIHIISNYLKNSTADSTTGTGSGMQLNGVQGMEVKDNYVINANGAEGIAQTSGQSEISGNFVDGGGTTTCGTSGTATVGGILLWQASNTATNINVHDNRLRNNCQFGIKLDFGANTITAQDINIHDNQAWTDGGSFQQSNGFIMANTPNNTGDTVLNSVHVYHNDFSLNTSNAVKLNGTNAGTISGFPWVWDNAGSPDAGMGLGTLATCDANLRGKYAITEGTTGNADVTQECLKNSSNAYAWVTK